MGRTARSRERIEPAIKGELRASLGGIYFSIEYPASKEAEAGVDLVLALLRVTYRRRLLFVPWGRVILN